jgi:ribonuclease HI
MKYSEITIYTDGGARGNPGPAAIGITASGISGETLFEISEYIGHETNNVAEYTAVIHALKHLQENNFQSEKITFILDSELIVRQILGIYKVKEPRLKILNQNVREQIQSLKSNHGLKTTNFINVPRNKNKRADQLVNQALDLLQ